MKNGLREKYKVEKSNVEKAYEYQLALKNNEEYEERVDSTFLALANLFKEMYPNVKIEPPRGREKSKKSLKTKIENLEIERLCKLYAIEEISQEEKEALYQAILNAIKNKDKETVEKIFFKKITNLKFTDKIMQDEEIPDNIKTALLRIIKTRLQKEETKNREELQKELDEKYGKKAAEKSKQLKDNLLKWENIEKINKEDMDKLNCPFEYLKPKDVRGIKIIVAEVPDDMQTNNKELKQLIERKSQSESNEKVKYNDLCCMQLTKEFAFSLMENEELQESLNIMVLPDGYKHKEKQNGYIAEHIKFCYRDHPEFTFELQLRSIYREDLSRAHGPAAHDRRAGKRRVFPSVTSKKDFIEQAKEMIPQYTVLNIENNEFKLHKCTMKENMTEYYLGYVKLNDEEYKRVMQYVMEEEEIQK